MSSNSSDHHPSGRQNSGARKITDAPQTKDPQEKRIVVLAIPAINAKQQIKNEKKRGGKGETESEKREEEESQNGQESEEEECGDWARKFAQQLIDANEGRIPPHDEQVTMIPNPFFKELLHL